MYFRSNVAQETCAVRKSSNDPKRKRKQNIYRFVAGKIEENESQSPSVIHVSKTPHLWAQRNVVQNRCWKTNLDFGRAKMQLQDQMPVVMIAAIIISRMVLKRKSIVEVRFWWTKIGTQNETNDDFENREESENRPR